MVAELSGLAYTFPRILESPVVAILYWTTLGEGIRSWQANGIRTSMFP